MSTRETVVRASADLVKAALPFADIVRLEGDLDDDGRPEEIGPGGSVKIFDGDPGEPEETFSPHLYIYEHRIPIRLGAYESDGRSRREILNDMLGAIGARILQDDTLGGLCDAIYPEAPTFEEISVGGAVNGRWADAAIIAIYSTTSPLL